MVIIVGMTGKAVRWCPAIDSVLMTRSAGHIGMPARQRERRIVMIEGCTLPSCCGVTRSTISTELPVVSIVCGMTCITARRRTSEHTIRMAGAANRVHMTASQWKCSMAMVETHICPTAGDMTRSAVRAKLAVVPVIIGVAGKAVFRCASEYIIDVTGTTGNAGVRSC
jgi:hypothetical protein